MGDSIALCGASRSLLLANGPIINVHEIDALTPVSFELPNGLRALVIHRPHSHRQVIHAQIAVGSRFEAEADNGISHFLEHMLYRGTPKHPSAHALSLAFEGMGGTLMASTATDTGDLAIAIPPVNFTPVLELFADVFRTPLFSGIEIERGIVTEEILEGLDDHGACVDPNDLIRALVFEGHPLGMPITGTLTQLRSFDVAALQRHHQRHYNGAGSVISFSGPLEPSQVVPVVERLFAGVPRGALPDAVAPVPQTERRFRYVAHKSSQTQVRLGFRAPSLHDPDEAAMEVLTRLLDDGMSTRLYHRLCDEKGLCYDVGGNYESYTDAGLLELSAETGHERAAQVLEELLGLITDLRDPGPTEDELVRVKQRFRWQLDVLLDSVSEVAQFFSAEVANGTHRTPRSRLESIERLEVADLVRVARKWLVPQNLSVVAVGLLAKPQLRLLEKQVARFV